MMPLQTLHSWTVNVWISLSNTFSRLFFPLNSEIVNKLFLNRCTKDFIPRAREYICSRWNVLGFKGYNEWTKAKNMQKG